MKQYTKLYSFGCSFTEGGGLNNQNFHRYLKGDTNYSKINESILPEHTQYAFHTSYPGQLAKLLNCEVENYGTSRSSNESIFNTAFAKISKLNDTENILVTVQTSILSRILLQLPHENKSITVNNFNGIDGSIRQYYELYICEFFDSNYACDKLLQDIDVYTSWFKEKNIDIVWLIYEMELDKFPLSNKSVLDFNNLDLMRFVHTNKLTLTDLPKFPYQDSHFSPKGHEVIANKIYEHLKKL